MSRLGIGCDVVVSLLFGRRFAQSSSGSLDSRAAVSQEAVRLQRKTGVTQELGRFGGETVADGG
jgi:hypothetical protein